jgi:hypothetical protein
MGSIVLVALVVLALRPAVCNRLVGRRNRFKNAFSPLGIPPGLRDDLIPRIPRPARRS